MSTFQKTGKYTLNKSVEVKIWAMCYLLRTVLFKNKSCSVKQQKRKSYNRLNGCNLVNVNANEWVLSSLKKQTNCFAFLLKICSVCFLRFLKRKFCRLNLLMHGVIHTCSCKFQVQVCLSKYVWTFFTTMHLMGQYVLNTLLKKKDTFYKTVDEAAYSIVIIY